MLLLTRALWRPLEVWESSVKALAFRYAFGVQNSDVALAVSFVLPTYSCIFTLCQLLLSLVYLALNVPVKLYITDSSGIVDHTCENSL